MITEETIQKLNDMRLHTMAKVLREILATAPGNALSFEEKVGILVDREWTDRDNRRLSRRLKEAKLGTGRAILEDVTVDPARGLEKSVVREMATCAWARAKQNVVIIGATGVGKSYLGAALAQHLGGHAAAGAGAHDADVVFLATGLDLHGYWLRGSESSSSGSSGGTRCCSSRAAARICARARRMNRWMR